MRGYIPALIDLAAVRPTEGVKTGAMDLRSQRTLPPRRVDGPARVRVRRVVTPLSLARQKFHAASRSFSLSLSFFFPFLFFLFFSYTPDLASVIGPRHAPMPLLFVSVRFEFALPSSRLATLPYLSRRRAHTRLLIPFPVFPLARLYELPYDLPFRFISTSRRAGEPVFRGETLLQRILFVPLT